MVWQYVRQALNQQSSSPISQVRVNGTTICFDTPEGTVTGWFHNADILQEVAATAHLEWRWYARATCLHLWVEDPTLPPHPDGRPTRVGFTVHLSLDGPSHCIPARELTDDASNL